MKVGMIGLGKLGLPVAVAIAQKFSVTGYDINPELCRYRRYEHMEKGPAGNDDFQVHFLNAFEGNNCPGLEFTDSLPRLVGHSDIIFVAVQTPHKTELDGSQRIRTPPEDFDYSYLIQVARDLAPLVRPEQTVAVISTVLPGTIRQEILPILGGKCNVVYNPSFIALGTTMQDFLHPEFVLIGEERHNAQALVDFYFNMMKWQKCKCLRMSIESAELTKLAYNTFICQKITWLNTLMEIAHRTPHCNVDDVTRIFSEITRPTTSFTKAGMSFGGACFPRDCIAMSWLAQKKYLSHNLFGELVRIRENQMMSLAQLVVDQSLNRSLPIVLLGKAFKGDTSITAGSPALLLADILKDWGVEFTHHDSYMEKWVDYTSPAVFFIATKHNCFKHYSFPKGSVVLDPWRYIEPQEGVEVIPIGVGQ